eukprot:Skav217561  [mRNA]  locus=scaffold1602:495811:497747:+ [translate_table: standard]
MVSWCNGGELLNSQHIAALPADQKHVVIHHRWPIASIINFKGLATVLMGWCLFAFASVSLRVRSRDDQLSCCRSVKGPRAVVSLKTSRAPQLVLAANGAEWWEEGEPKTWKLKQRASDPALQSPFFSLAVDESSQVVAVGGGAGRCASIFGFDASLLATLQGHTGWVRDILFHEGQLYSIGCNFIKVWRPKEISKAGWRSCSHVGDLEVNGDLLALAACGGFLVAAGASRYRHQWKLPKALGRPKDWMDEMQASLQVEPSLHKGRVTCLSCWNGRLLSCGHDGEVVLDGQRTCLGQSRLLSIAIVDEEHVAVGSEDGHLYLLNAELQTLETLMPFGPRPINGLTALPGGRFAAVSAELDGFHVGSFMEKGNRFGCPLMPTELRTSGII